MNFLNTEKQKRITEIETLYEMKKQKGTNKLYDSVDPSKAPDLAVSYQISQNIKQSIKLATESVYAGTIQGKDSDAGKDYMSRMMKNTLSNDERAVAGNAPKGTS